jgi:hypothetical protein
MFPPHIESVFEHYGVRADTKAALFDLYVSMGDEVLEVFGDIAEKVASAASLSPDDTLTIREAVVDRYLRRNHPLWAEGTPTPSLWHPRVAQGRASGLATPIGSHVAVSRRVVGVDQPISEGTLVLGRNAHYGGREATISFDVVAADIDDALAIGKAIGQQHTLPGSVGQTSGSYDSIHNLGLIWEIQPNVYKPAGDRNRQISRVYRRHRNWHLVTLACALDWLRQKDCVTYILRGEALAATHEVNPQKPVSPTIVDLHNRTVQQVVRSLGFTLREVAEEEKPALLSSVVMNHALRMHVMERGLDGLMWRISP